MMMLRPAFKQSIRQINSANSQIFPAIRSKTEIKELLSNPTWNIYDELIHQNDDDSITTPEFTQETIDKLLKMSGLELVDKANIAQKLKEQVVFINKLHSVEVTDGCKKVNDTNPLTLSNLMKRIDEQSPDELKAENGGWQPTKLASLSKNDYYLVREGLIKK